MGILIDNRIINYIHAIEIVKVCEENVYPRPNIVLKNNSTPDVDSYNIGKLKIHEGKKYYRTFIAISRSDRLNNECSNGKRSDCKAEMNRIREKKTKHKSK